jgi:hypothetical protein
MLFQGQIANAVPAARQTGQPNAAQLWLGELAVSEVLPRYAALAQSGQLFTARAALQATSLVATAMVGLQLWNRSTTKNLILLKAGGNIVATSATQTGVALAFGTQGTAAPSSQTAITSAVNNFIGGAAPAALALTAGTFAVAPVNQIDLLHNTAAIASTGEDVGYFVDLEGSVVLPPGTFAAFSALGAAGAASSNNHWLMWAELPI